MAQDATGAVIAGGQFMTTVSIDGAPNLTVPATNDKDGYVVKYDATGHYEWLVHLTGVGAASVRDLVVDASGDVLVTGAYTGQLVIAGSATTTATSEDSYVMKLDGDSMRKKYGLRGPKTEEEEK